jgi:hypothetical protein
MSLIPVGMLCPSLNIPTPSTASDSPTYGKRRRRYYLYRDSENREPCLALGSQPASISSCAGFLQHCIPITTTRRSADCDKYKTTVLLSRRHNRNNQSESRITTAPFCTVTGTICDFYLRCSLPQALKDCVYAAKSS